jgi:predicted peptidase
LSEEVRKAVVDGTRIKYTVFIGSSVIPDQRERSGLAHHLCTWPVAYGIEGIRDWLFANAKNKSKKP